MLKTTWAYVAIAVALSGAGAAAYYFAHETKIVQPNGPTAEPAGAAATAPANSTSSDDDVKRKTLEGIGSIKKLKPVPLQPSQQR